MNRFCALAPLVGLAGLAIAATPAAAQDGAGDRVNQVIIYGEDECPVSTADTITVCARLDESERFRIPQRLRESDDPANQAWSQRVRSFETVGAFGPLSCTTAGAGGELGCTAQFIEAAYAERAQGSEVRMGQLIEQARGERLAEIDAEAAATQSRVEELERAYLERVRREQEGETATAIDPTPPPVVADPARVPGQGPLQPPDFDETDREPLDGGPAPVGINAPGAPGQLGARP